MSVHTQSVENGARKTKKWLLSGGKIALCIVLVVGIFATGVGVGNGKIQLHRLSNVQNKQLPDDLDYSQLESVYDTLRANYDGKLDVQKLLDGMKAGMAEASGDPYTVYLNAKNAEEFNKQLNGTFSGIGAELGQDDNKNLIIVAPIAGFPAAKAGLRPQDIVTTINDKTTEGMNTVEAVTKIRGPKGSKVKLGVIRDKKQELSFTITREDIKVPSVKHEVLDGNVGYMSINQFSDDTGKLAHEAAQSFADKHVKGVVLDLRGNPGGLLTASVDVASLWLPKGATILQERRGGVVISTETATGDNPLAGLPTAVLIDSGSASASEIVAGALKDNKVATLFGIKSYGKGSVQQIQQLPGGSELKVTVARWYRPNGQNIDKKGISPDTEVKLSSEELEAKRDPQKDAALQFIKSK